MNKSTNQIISTNQALNLSIELVRQNPTTREQINAPTTINHQEKLLATNQLLISSLIRSGSNYNKSAKDQAIKLYSPESTSHKDYTERLTVTIPKQLSPNIDRLNTPKGFMPIAYQGLIDYKISDESSKNSSSNSWVEKLAEQKKSNTKQNCLIM